MVKSTIKQDAKNDAQNHNDKYRDYLAQDDNLDDNSKNPRNLFDELNSKDTKWLKIARLNLSKRSHV